MTTLDDFYYQKTTEAKTQEEKEYYIQQQSKSWEENRGYSDYAAQIITPGHSVSEQYEFLKNYYDTYKNEKGKKKGLAAKNLRDEIRNKTRFNLDGLFQVDESFMNNELRDFLNLKEDGTMNYTLRELRAALRDLNSGWRELRSFESAFHQTETDGINLNVKFVNIDGREVIIARNGNVIIKGVDYGTFNYADPSNAKKHNRYDVVPYQNQYAGKYVLRFYSDLNSRPNSYYWHRKNWFGKTSITPVITISKEIVQHTYGWYVGNFMNQRRAL